MNIGRHINCAILAASSLAAVAQQPSTLSNPQATHPQSQPVQTQPVQPSGATPNIPASSTLQTPAEPKPATESEQPSLSATPGTTSSGGTPAGVDNAHYVIGAEDALQITVWREPQLSGTFPVRPDGMISMVLLGDLPAAGVTPMQLSANISQRLRKYYQDLPNVTVQVMAVNSQRIYLVGEVGHVGPVGLSAGMTPLQAIASAGGLSPFAHAKHIYILRGTGPSQQKIPFNYKQALKGDNRQPILLRPGDTIVVP